MKKVFDDIKIDENVLTYMAKKGKDTFTLDINKSGGGCCPTIEVAEVTLKRPENEDNYKHYIENEIHVYVSKSARVTTPVLKFILGKSFFSRNIVPVGLSLKNH